MQVQVEIDNITSFLQREIGSRNAVVGVSGGIDSALTLMLVARTFPEERIKAFFLPDGNTPESDYRDVDDLAKASGVHIGTINIQPMVDAFRTTLKVEGREALGNIKSRTRMISLYYQSNTNNGMVVGTTNRSEYIVGYYTKFGDGACDIEPIMHLLKRDVREMAHALNVPESIMNKKPSAGLWASQTDESELGMTYDELDQAIVEIFDHGSEEKNPVYDRVRELYRNSSHKRRTPEGLE